MQVEFTEHHQNVRAQTHCELCRGHKDEGLLVCWHCYKSFDLRNGIKPWIVNVLDEADKVRP